MDAAGPARRPATSPSGSGSRLRATYRALGHEVELIEPVPGLPDMVFAANGGLVVDGQVLTARFHHAERVAEGPAYRDWFVRNGFAAVHDTVEVNEGEGDLAVAGPIVLAGTGFRTTPAAHREAQERLGRPVISLQLVDPSFYHLDTALFVLDEQTIAYYPAAFSPGSVGGAGRLFPDAVEATAADAAVLGLNAVSDGRNVVLSSAATGLAVQLAAPRVRLRPRGPVRVAQGRRRTEVLHPGDSAMTISPAATPAAFVPGQQEPAAAGAGLQHAPGSHLAPNYHPLPVVIAQAEGAWVTDVEGRRYLDCLAGYSALNFGHGHPRLLAAAHRQLERLTLTSRAFQHDQLEEFAEELAGLAGEASRGVGGPAMDLVLPMNTGAEAVETAIKMGRKWGYDVKGVPADAATIVVAAGNFHGRTTTIVCFSTDPVARDGFGPFTPGFRIVPYGDAAALEAAMDDTTVAVLIEPIQGEAGVIIPPRRLPGGGPRGLRRPRRAVRRRRDPVRAGPHRHTFACEREGVMPDVLVLGKALGGGIVPVSAVVARAELLGVLSAGTHGSTFGGNPLACAVGRAVVELLRTGEYQARAGELGEVLRSRLEALVGNGVLGVRVAGLWAGVDIDPALGTGRALCERLAARGVLAKDTHGSTIRLAPPLVVAEDDLAWALDQLEGALGALARGAA